MRRSAALGAALFAAAALAQAPASGEPEGELPPVVVPLPPMEPQVESPSRRDPSGAITVIDASEHRGEAKETAQLLASAPGVALQDTGGLGQAKMLSVRGASATGVLVYLDGIPLNGAGGSVDLSRVPAAIIEQLEVLRGGAGARYGSGGLGGALHISTKRPKEGGELFGEVSYGSFETAQGQLSASGSLLGGHGLLLLHGSRSRGNFPFQFDEQPNVPDNPLLELTRENNDAAFGGGLAKFLWAPAPRWFAEAMAELSIEQRGLAGPEQNPTPLRQKSGRLSATGHAQRQFDDGELSIRAYARREEIALGIDSLSEQLELSTGGELEGRLLVGRAHSLGTLLQASNESILPFGTNPSWLRGSAMAWDDILLLEGGIIVSPSLRVDQTGPFTGLSPKLGATALLPAGFELRSNAGQAHRAPSFTELYIQQARTLPNKELRPERSLYADLGLSHRTASSYASAMGFYSLYEDLILYEYAGPNAMQPRNIEAAMAYGLEAKGELRPHPLASLAVGYTLLFTQNLRDDPRYYLKELPYRPRHRLHARLSGGPKIARGRVEVDFQSQLFMNRAETLALPGRAFVNLGVSSALWRSPEVVGSLEVKNVFDVRALDWDRYPLPGRAAYVTVSIAMDAGKINEVTAAK
ncbi:MAG: TonB-dependent receptor [Myxococcales bacterium]|nr:TonB-dependent receptor [Myxococcales bacterium]